MTFYGFFEPHVGLTEPHVGVTIEIIFRLHRHSN